MFVKAMLDEEWIKSAVMFAVCLLIELSRTFTCSLPYHYHYPTYKVLDVCLRENRYHSQKEIIFRSVSLVFFRVSYTHMESIF